MSLTVKRQERRKQGKRETNGDERCLCQLRLAQTDISFLHLSTRIRKLDWFRGGDVFSVLI